MRYLAPFLFTLLSIAAAEDAAPVQISTSLPIFQKQLAELALDGNDETFFQSARPVRDGDDLLLKLPQPTEVSAIEVLTGRSNEANALAFGALEVSRDGSNFTVAAPFVAGMARALELKEKVQAIRIRVTGGDGNALAIREIKITTPAPLPVPQFVTRFEADTGTVPECAPFAKKAVALCEEWHPKLREILASGDQPSPRSVVKLIFRKMDGVAHTAGGSIHISADWVTKRAPGDYGMVIHELVHVVQSYRGGEFWVTEGIADYIRDKYFEPGVRKHRIDPEKSNYKQGYGTAGAFLLWLEENKDPKIVSKLNAALRERRYSPDMFKESCGAELDELWKEFVSSRAAG